MLYDFPGCKNSWILMLPIFLLQRLDLLVLIIEILMLVFDCDFHSVVVVDSVCILFAVWKFMLTSVASFASSQGDFDGIERSDFIVFCFVLDWLHSFIFK